MEIIANRPKPNLDVTGNVYFGSKRLNSKDRREVVSFVSQESPLLGEFTVRETLWFAARLYFGYRGTPRKTISDKIDHVIKSVGLTACADVKVGSLFFRGLSGGQKKRLSLAVELISSPPIIILDEPTSGLDSSSAFGVIMALKNLAQMGHTILATIHQPSSQIWQCLTNILLLSEGKYVYFGSAERAKDYFASLNLICPDHFNPGDYFSAILNTDFKSKERENVPSIDSLRSSYDASAVKRMELQVHLDEITEHRKTIAHASRRQTKANKRISGRITNANILQQEEKYDKLEDNKVSILSWILSPTSSKHVAMLSSTLTLFHRNMMSLYRNPGILMVRLVVYMTLGLFLGLLYLNYGRQLDTQNVLGISSVLLSCVGFFSFLSISVIPFVMETRSVTNRERKNGAYKLSSLVLANTLAIFPLTLILSIVAVLIVYFMVGLNNFFEFFIGLWILLFCSETFVQMLSSILKNPETAVSIAIGFIGILFLCSGFFIPVDNMSWGIRWIAYVSPIRYIFRMFMRNQWTGVTNINSLIYPNGEAILNFFGLNNGLIVSFWGDFGVLCSFSAAYILITLFFGRSK